MLVNIPASNATQILRENMNYDQFVRFQQVGQIKGSLHNNALSAQFLIPGTEKMRIPTKDNPKGEPPVAEVHRYSDNAGKRGWEVLLPLPDGNKTQKVVKTYEAIADLLNQYGEQLKIAQHAGSH
jgi:hypothetical protein